MDTKTKCRYWSTVIYSQKAKDYLLNLAQDVCLWNHTSLFFSTVCKEYKAIAKLCYHFVYKVQLLSLKMMITESINVTVVVVQMI